MFLYLSKVKHPIASSELKIFTEVRNYRFMIEKRNVRQ